MTRVWYLVRDFDRGREFCKRLLGFEETFVDRDDRNRVQPAQPLE
jgi:hypothetical protein